MNLDRYEKIDGRAALKRLAEGEKVIRETGSPYFINEEGRFVCDNAAIYRPHVTDLTLNEILKECDWYIPKPFDVRQAMFDRPNEWVAAYNDERGKWIQVGFDTVNMRPVKAYHGYTGGVEGANGDFPTGYELETCIPIEDVPEEATR